MCDEREVARAEWCAATFTPGGVDRAALAYIHCTAFLHIKRLRQPSKQGLAARQGRLGGCWHCKQYKLIICHTASRSSALRPRTPRLKAPNPPALSLGRPPALQASRAAGAIGAQPVSAGAGRSQAAVAAATSRRRRHAAACDGSHSLSNQAAQAAGRRAHGGQAPPAH